MAIVIPAILTDSEEEYQKRLLAAEYVSNVIQVDIVDGKFAENTTIGTNVIKKCLSSSRLEIQIMAVYPQNYIDDLMFVDHVERIIVPFEIEGDLGEIIYHIKNHDKKVGISLNPKTPVQAALHFLDDVDLLLLLAVEPGFSGQKFQDKVIDKVIAAKKLVPGLAIEVDGGVNFENARQIAASGADFLAANSVLYGALDFRLAYEKLARLVATPNNNY